MATTAELIDRVCHRVGTNSATPGHFTRPMVATWLSEAQRTLCIEGPILKTCFQGTGQANVELLELPTPDFVRIVRIDLRRAGSVNRRLVPMGHIIERSPDRTTALNDTPCKYAIWAGNDASGNNSKGIMFDKNFGSTWPSPDLFIYIRQIPKTMVDAGQAPEVKDSWQDICVDYAEIRARLRMAIMDPQQAQLAKMAIDAWEVGKQRARDVVEPEGEDEPIVITDAMGYLNQDEDLTV